MIGMTRPSDGVFGELTDEGGDSCRKAWPGRHVVSATTEATEP